MRRCSLKWMSECRESVLLCRRNSVARNGDRGGERLRFWIVCKSSLAMRSILTVDVACDVLVRVWIWNEQENISIKNGAKKINSTKNANRFRNSRQNIRKLEISRPNLEKCSVYNWIWNYLVSSLPKLLWSGHFVRKTTSCLSMKILIGNRFSILLIYALKDFNTLIRCTKSYETKNGDKKLPQTCLNLFK